MQPLFRPCRLRWPKPGTAKANTVRDEGDPLKRLNAAVLKLDRDDRERDG
jgi:hypothetical protein